MDMSDHKQTSTVSSWATPSENVLKKAQEIVSSNNVQQVSSSDYLVKSTSSGTIYGVEIGVQGIFKCECQSAEHRGYCSHIEAVKLSINNEQK